MHNKMHLLFYIPSLASGGAERVLTKLANQFTDEGHIVTLVTQTSIICDHYPIRPEVSRISLAASAQSQNPIQALLSNMRRIVRLRRVIKTQKPDIVLTFMPTANVVALIAALGLEVPTVIAERVHPPFAHVSKWRRKMQQLTYPRAQTTVVLSSSSASYLAEAFGLTQVAVIPNSISLPLPQFSPTRAPADFVPSNGKLVLFVGRMVEQKQPIVVLRAFLEAQTHLQDWHLVMIGDGELAAEVDAIIDQQAAPATMQRFSRLGNLQDWYERADVFVSASLFEGSPNALMEAMACGCAVIASDCPTGPGDIIHNEENGVLLSLKELDNLAQHLQTLCNDEPRRERLVDGAATISAKYSDQQFFDDWRRVLGLGTPG
ncbi:MAG: glycosyltransferase involved in cell wall biosynthesis [Limisphaerales bacterium]|jgi:glycosyltransferase involved in cell wall biosynthesis